MSRALRWLACGCCWACTASGSGPGDTGDGGGSPIDAAGNPSMPQGGTDGSAASPSGEAGDASSGSPGASGGAAGHAGQSPEIITGLEETNPYPASQYPAENPYTREKALLGKILFWEEQLSSHDTHACGTCHRPSAGGSDPRAVLEAALGAGPNGLFDDADDARGSPGVVRCDSEGAPKPDPIYGLDVQVTARKAPSAMDAWFFDRLFWDGRADASFFDPVTGELAIARGGALESQAAAPPLNDVEMSCEAQSWPALETKLKDAVPLQLARQLPADVAVALDEHPSYPALFEWVYGTPEISARRIVFAIATYERQLRSDQTPWDRFNAGDSDALTPDQQAGLALFNVKARCATCHPPPLFSDGKFHHIGAQAPDLDPGVSSITGEAADLGKMKTPSLRNVGLRAPGGLFHFGTESGATLRSVVGVYRQGGIHHDNLDPEIRTLNLPDFELEQLLNFLQNGLTDPRAAAELPPFDRPRLRSEE